jgi:ribonuclease HI
VTLILGLNILKDLKEKRIVVHGDFELVIKQVNGSYQTKHPRMREYRNSVLDLLDFFFHREYYYTDTKIPKQDC